MGKNKSKSGNRATTKKSNNKNKRKQEKKAMGAIGNPGPVSSGTTIRKESKLITFDQSIMIDNKAGDSFIKVKREGIVDNSLMKTEAANIDTSKAVEDEICDGSSTGKVELGDNSRETVDENCDRYTAGEDGFGDNSEEMVDEICDGSSTGEVELGDNSREKVVKICDYSSADKDTILDNSKETVDEICDGSISGLQDVFIDSSLRKIEVDTSNDSKAVEDKVHLDKNDFSEDSELLEDINVDDTVNSIVLKDKVVSFNLSKSVNNITPGSKSKENSEVLLGKNDETVNNSLYKSGNIKKLINFFESSGNKIKSKDLEFVNAKSSDKIEFKDKDLIKDIIVRKNIVEVNERPKSFEDLVSFWSKRS